MAGDPVSISGGNSTRIAAVGMDRRLVLSGTQVCDFGKWENSTESLPQGSCLKLFGGCFERCGAKYLIWGLVGETVGISRGTYR